MNADRDVEYADGGRGFALMDVDSAFDTGERAAFDSGSSSDGLGEELFESDDSDSDDDFVVAGAMVCFAAVSTEINVRETFYARQRMIWREHVLRLRRENRFDRTYRMDEAHFNRLVALLSPGLEVDIVVSTRRTGVAPISEEVVLHCTLRYLAGGSYLDVRDVAHVSVPSFYRCLHKGIAAIVKCSELDISLPTTAREIDHTASEFKHKSSEGILDGCVGCADGMLLKIKTPSRKDAGGNVRAYFSGHYYHMGLNIHAVCDHLCRFTFFAVAAPGGSSDLWAFARTKLAKYTESLGDNRYLIGDGAYTPTEHMLTPFGGTGRFNRAHDTFDFYASQLRIKIEQTFGRFNNKWCCIKYPLQRKPRNASRDLMAMARLHIYCSDLSDAFAMTEASENVRRSAENAELSGQARLGYFPSDPLEPEAISIDGVSDLRERLVHFIQQAALTRPHRNIVRRASQCE